MDLLARLLYHHLPRTVETKPESTASTWLTSRVHICTHEMRQRGPSKTLASATHPQHKMYGKDGEGDIRNTPACETRGDNPGRDDARRLWETRPTLRNVGIVFQIDRNPLSKRFGG